MEGSDIFVFSSSPGVVGAVITGHALPFAVAIGGQGNVPSFPAWHLAKAILTGFDVRNMSGLGVTHSLRDRIYVYVFGERMGEATVSGLAFAGTCAGNPSVGRPWTGFDAVHAYYERARVSTQGAPVRLVFGPDTTLFGFMQGFQFQLIDAENGLGSFAFQFRTIPRTSSGATRTLPWDASIIPGIPLSEVELTQDQYDAPSPPIIPPAQN